MVPALLIAQLFNVLIGWEFFFAGPGVVSGLIAICLATAAIALYRTNQAGLATQHIINA